MNILQNTWLLLIQLLVKPFLLVSGVSTGFAELDSLLFNVVKNANYKFNLSR